MPGRCHPVWAISIPMRIFRMRITGMDIEQRNAKSRSQAFSYQ